MGLFTSKPDKGAFFTKNENEPLLVIYANRRALGNKNPLPLTSPNGIKYGYYFIAIFDTNGYDYLGEIASSQLYEMRDYSFTIDTPCEKLSEIFKRDCDYFKNRILFAKKQLEHI